MKVNISNAAKRFFASSSLESVYIEAVENSIDAGAHNIEIKINIDSFSKPETLKIEIIDNGIGFVDKNFEKFSKLMEIDEKDRQGLGRLVFLNYFKRVDISSIYSNKKRTFTFNDKFDGEFNIIDAKSDDNKTILFFTGYLLEKVHSHDYIKPESIKKSLLLHFLPLFYRLKVSKNELKIKINLQTKESNLDYGFFSDTRELIMSQIPELESETFKDEQLDLFEELNLYYSVKENLQEQNVITAICVDERTIPIDIISKEETPQGYEIIFLLYSDLFTGKANLTRQELTLEEADLRIVKKIFRAKVSKILNEKIPIIQERNKKTNELLEDRFPHLRGYFDEKPVGLIDRNQSLEIAQAKFFKAQKEILDAESLTEEQYQKSLEISSRLLTEYILYRNIIINKLKEIDPNSSEADIHNIIVPMRKTFAKTNFINDLYTNNAWLLDDKYMSYTTIFSDKDMDELIKNISSDDEKVEKDKKQPDIAIVFSNDPNKTSKVDVVIVELKRLGLDIADKETVVSQLRQRARKILQYYPDKIQRIWFYGIVDINDEFKRSLLEDKYAELFSNGTVFYKEQPIIIDLEKKTEIPVGLYILSFDAFLEDAESRNSTFLKILKEGFKNKK